MPLNKGTVIRLIVVSDVLLLCFGIWYWTWPDRTLAKFERLVSSDRAAAAKLIVEDEPEEQPPGASDKLYLPFETVTPKQPRSMSDVLGGVRRFGTPAHGKYWVAERSRIVIPGSCRSCHSSSLAELRAEGQ
jgi:hypothetical protein